ncbi:DUF6251 family protein [Streptomyces sp. NBC_01262]|uniref:DUF6251 family protein n=1 Tax=Streptomyces sp. NBC_01262 TaxID=2903803 RepID=UPI002E343FA3|nr:DUF6251 family protein [Streptomyces sp. NBC_01262]
MSTPKRYRFDNQLPTTRTPAPLPVHRPVPLPEQQQADGRHQEHQVVVQHFHAAPPDRTLQRLALGAGMGAGAVAAGVYFLPMLIIAVQSLVAALMTLAVILAVACWAIVTIVQAVGGSTGNAAAKTLTRTRRGRLRRR